MKKFEKAELIAKNLPTGSYSAGCPTNYYMVTRPNGKGPCCKACEKKQ